MKNVTTATAKYQTDQQLTDVFLEGPVARLDLRRWLAAHVFTHDLLFFDQHLRGGSDDEVVVGR